MFLLTCLLTFLICPSLSWAQSVANVDAVVSYTEPDRVVGGAALTQLQHTTIYFEVRDVGGVVLEQWTEKINATDPTGAGGIVYNLPPKQVTDEAVVLMVWVSASNPVGESAKSVAVSKAIPKIDLNLPDGVLDLNVTISIKISTPQ